MLRVKKNSYLDNLVRSSEERRLNRLGKKVIRLKKRSDYLASIHESGNVTSAKVKEVDAKYDAFKNKYELHKRVYDEAVKATLFDAENNSFTDVYDRILEIEAQKCQGTSK